LRYNTDSSKVELYDGSQWTEVQSSRPDLDGGARGLFSGGYTPVSPHLTNIIDYVTISSTGNAIDFGDLTSGTVDGSSCSSSTRALIANSNVDNRIDFVTIASTGNAQDFGDVTTLSKVYAASASNSTRGIWAGGRNPSPTLTILNVIDYVTIASIGNAQDFGDLTVARANVSGLSSPTRAVFSGGYTGPSFSGLVNTIDFITISTLGNASDFGDLTATSSTGINRGAGGCSNSTRGLFGGGGYSAHNIIEYITISTLGNSIKFGELTRANTVLGACSSPTRGLFAGGFPNNNTIDYVTIQAQGNAVDFGDLTRTSARHCGGCSNAHGGL